MKWIIAAFVGGCLLASCTEPMALHRLCDGSDPTCDDTMSRPWATPTTPNPPCDLPTVQTVTYTDKYGSTYTFTITSWAHYDVCPAP